MQNSKRALTLIFLTLCIMVLGGCDKTHISITAKFNSTQDIQSGTPVFFEKAKIGQVSDVQLNDVGSSIEMELALPAASTIQANAAVVVNRMKPGMPLEIYNRASFDANGEELNPVQEGQALHGLDSMFELGAWMVGDAIQLGVGTASKVINSFQNYLQGDDFTQDKQELNAKVQAASEAAAEAVQGLQLSLSQAASDFKVSEQLAADSLTQLGEEFAPIVEELAATGAKLAEQVEQVEQGLKQMQPEQRKAGEQLLASLLETIEKLDQSLQQGLQQGAAEHRQAEAD